MLLDCERHCRSGFACADDQYFARRWMRQMLWQNLERVGCRYCGKKTFDEQRVHFPISATWLEREFSGQ